MPVYQYKGQPYELPEGLSNEEAKERIEAYLTQSNIIDSSLPKEQPMKEQEDEGSSFTGELSRQLGLTGRYLIKGVSTPANIVTDAVSGAVNLGAEAMGSDFRLPYMSQMQEEGLSKMFPSPKPGLEQAVKTGSEAVASMLVPGMSTAGPLLSAEKEGVKAAGETARRAMAEGVSVATGAIVGEKAAQEAYEITGSPWASLAAGLATGTVVGSGSGKAAFGLSGPRKQPVTIQEIRQRASRGYKAMEDAQMTVSSDSVKNKFLPKVISELDKNNFDPQIVGAHKDIQDQIRLVDKLIQDPTIDFRRLETLRSSFSSMAKGTDDKARLAKIVVGELDTFMANLSPSDLKSKTGKSTETALKALGDARTDWRNQARAQVIQDILDSATARSEGSTASQAEQIKRGLVNLTANTEKMKMFSTREQNVIKAAAKSSDLETMLSILARFNPQRGTLQSALTVGALYDSIYGTSPTRGAVGLTLGAGGYAADKLQGVIKQREAVNLIDQLATGKLQAPKEGFATPGLFGSTMGMFQTSPNVTVTPNNQNEPVYKE
jgi:hypothetical protein